MVYLCLALFVYVCFALKNNKIIKTTLGNEIIVPGQEKEQKISWLAVVVLILFSGLRAHSVGSDLVHYKWVFDRIAQNHNINAGDYFYGALYKILNWFCSLISVEEIGFTILLVIISAIVVLFAVVVAKTVSKDISMAMFLFVCFDVYISSFSMLRQSIAVAFVMLAFKFMIDRKPWNFVLCVLSAYYFHESAIFILPIYLFNFFSSQKKELIMYIIGFIIMVVFALYDEEIIIELCKILNLHYYSSYGMEGNSMTMMSYIKAFLMVGIFMFFLLYRFYCKKKNIQLSKTYSISLMWFYLTVLLNVYNIITGEFLTHSRMTYYFSWVLMLLVPEFLNSIENKKWKKIFTVVMIVAGICYLSTTVVLRDQFIVNPYKTIFGI